MCISSTDPQHRPHLHSKEAHPKHPSRERSHHERPDHSEAVEPSPIGETPLNFHLSWVTKAMILPILFYRKYISPLTPPSCRFSPTCSQYALDAYRHFGALRGSWYTLTRLLKCHPWHAGGYDPVILNEKNSEKKKTV